MADHRAGRAERRAPGGGAVAPLGPCVGGDHPERGRPAPGGRHPAGGGAARWAGPGGLSDLPSPHPAHRTRPTAYRVERGLPGGPRQDPGGRRRAPAGRAGRDVPGGAVHGVRRGPQAGRGVLRRERAQAPGGALLRAGGGRAAAAGPRLVPDRDVGAALRPPGGPGRHAGAAPAGDRRGRSESAAVSPGRAPRRSPPRRRRCRPRWCRRRSSSAPHRSARSRSRSGNASAVAR